MNGDPEKKKKRQQARIAAYKERQKKKAVRKGERYEKAADRKGKQALKHAAKSISTKNPVKKTMQSEKAAAAKVSEGRLKAAGVKAQSTKKTPPKKKTLVTTAQSAHDNLTSQDKYYSGSKRLRKEVRKH